MVDNRVAPNPLLPTGVMSVSSRAGMNLFASVVTVVGEVVGHARLAIIDLSWQQNESMIMKTMSDIVKILCVLG